MNAEIEARVGLLRQRMQEALQLLPNVPAELAAAIESITSASALADFVAGVSDARASEKQEILETIDVKERLDKLLALVAQRIEVLKLSKTIGEQTQQSLSSQQREHILREQLRQIQKELGEGDDKPAEIAELREQIEKADMPKEAAEQAKKELKRLERMPEAAAEYGMVRTYLEWLIELPWSKLDPDTIDVAEARRILDEDHYGLPKVKRRILEYLAVRKLNPAGQEPDPVLRRAARRRQDVARAEHRARHRPQVRAAQPGRRARRGGDSRPPAHLHRRAAGQHHPVDPQGRHPQPGDHARRGRQARPGLPRRSVVGPARSARSRAELRHSATTTSRSPSISRR